MLVLRRKLTECDGLMLRFLQHHQSVRWSGAAYNRIFFTPTSHIDRDNHYEWYIDAV